MAEATTVKAKETTTTRKRTAGRTPSQKARARELNDEEIYVRDPEPPRKTADRNTYSLDLDVPKELSDPWEHIVNAEKEYLLAFLSIFGLDVEELSDMARKRRAQPKREREVEHIEVKEVHVEEESAV